MIDAMSHINEWMTAAAPPPALSVSEWADAHRILPETSAARGARWRTATTPYLAGIMDAALEPGVRTIAVMKSHQTGGSEALLNIIGYFMEHDPCPMLLVLPTAEVAENFSKERLDTLVDSTPALRAAVREQRPGKADSTLRLKLFPGGFLALGGANTPNTFARWSVRLAIGDDVDRFPPVVGDEGDPADLLVNRTTSFPDRLALFVSTPVLKGGRIDSLWSRSDQRRYHVPCPQCGREDYLTWSDASHFRVVFDERDPQTARIECPDEEHGGCGAQIREPQRGALIAAGTWKATAEPQQPGLAAFHVWEALSPFVSLQELVEKFLTARARGREHFKAFVQTSLGEPWEDRTVRMEGHQLLSRVEDYGTLEDGTLIEIPTPAAAVTAGVDVQQDGFYLLVCAWGPASERWVVDWRFIPGDPKRPETQANLLEALKRRYVHASGVPLPIHATCIDSGYATDTIYDFVLAHQARWIFATKGVAGRSGEPIVGKFAQRRTGRNPRPVRLYPVNVDDGKASTLASLAIVGAGPNAIHFPARVESVDAEFFAQLTAEHRESRYNKGGIVTHQVWVADREENHALDAMVLTYVAFLLLRPNLRAMAAEIDAAAKLGATPQPTAPPPAPPRRREPWIERREGWLR